jgi:hypothetical protein
MKARILYVSLIAVLSLGAAAAFVGCDRDESTTAPGGTQDVGDRAADAVNRGVDKAGAGANTGINVAHDATTQAVDQARGATDSARTAVGHAAEKSGEAVGQAGHAVKDFVTPTTAPTTAASPAK